MWVWTVRLQGFGTEPVNLTFSPHLAVVLLFNHSVSASLVVTAASSTCIISTLHRAFINILQPSRRAHKRVGLIDRCPQPAAYRRAESYTEGENEL